MRRKICLLTVVLLLFGVITSPVAGESSVNHWKGTVIIIPIAEGPSSSIDVSVDLYNNTFALSFYDDIKDVEVEILCDGASIYRNVDTASTGDKWYYHIEGDETSVYTLIVRENGNVLATESLVSDN